DLEREERGEPGDVLAVRLEAPGAPPHEGRHRARDERRDGREEAAEIAARTEERHHAASEAEEYVRADVRVEEEEREERERGAPFFRRGLELANERREAEERKRHRRHERQEADDEGAVPKNAAGEHRQTFVALHRPEQRACRVRPSEGDAREQHAV